MKLSALLSLSACAVCLSGCTGLKYVTTDLKGKSVIIVKSGWGVDLSVGAVTDSGSPLSVEAGLDFMSALRRCTERPVVDPLSEELLRVVRETQIGTPRRDALRALAKRVAIPDVRSLVNALVQADELGVSVGAILRVQSDQIRQRRFERAEKLANEAPVKLLGPLVLFIFPSVFLVLLGPILFRLAAKS